MLVAALFGSFSVTELLIVLGAAGFLIERVIDARGWSRSSKTLRQENLDLIRHNDELEAKIQRMTLKIEEQAAALAELGAKVALLAASDQKAVLVALQGHQMAIVSALANHEGRNAARSESFMKVLGEISQTLKTAMIDARTR